jgi:hypothetical protein
MPRLSCWFIRASLAYLAAGFTLGALLLAYKGLPFLPALWLILPAHMEFLLIGWIVQLALGMAFWILPRFGQGEPRGNERLIGLSFALLNLGILLVSVQVIISLSFLPVIGRLFEIAAVALFISGSWKRIKPFAF